MPEELQTICDRFRNVRFQGRLTERARELPSRPALDRSGATVCDVATEDLAFLGDLFERAGLNLGRYRLTPLRRRVKACCRALRVPSVSDAQAMVRREPQAVPRAIDAVVLGVSEFFRDEAVFEELRTHVLPELAAVNRRLRVISIGCSDGRELYSIAMLLAEMDLLARCSLHGIDCRAEAVTQARAGRFSGAALEVVPDYLRARYFVADKSGYYQVRPDIRSRTTWSVANVFSLPALPACDLVLFRNLTIYLEPNWAAQAWRRVLPLIRPGGILVAGKAERPPDNADLLRLSPCIFRRSTSVHYA
jgi:chemotaxis protein methyltransferase CheR